MKFRFIYDLIYMSFYLFIFLNTVTLNAEPAARSYSCIMLQVHILLGRLVELEEKTYFNNRTTIAWRREKETDFHLRDITPLLQRNTDVGLIF